MRRAFTIVELLIVLGIIALLTSVVIKVSADAVIHARAVQVAVNLTAIMRAAQSRLLTNSATTADLADLDIDLEFPDDYASIWSIEIVIRPSKSRSLTPASSAKAISPASSLLTRQCPRPKMKSPIPRSFPSIGREGRVLPDVYSERPCDRRGASFWCGALIRSHRNRPDFSGKTKSHLFLQGPK